MLDPWSLILAGGAAAGAFAAADLFYSRSNRHETATLHGTARWAAGRDFRASGLLATKGVLLGRVGRSTLLRSADDAHLLTVAPTRSGKGVAAVIPNLLTYPGSVVVVDPKGENAMVTARARAALGQRVLVADPWGLTGREPARFNPLAWLDPDSPDLADDAALLADALVPDEGHGGNRFWDEEAKAWIGALLLYVRCCEPPALQTLTRMRELLTLGPRQTADLLRNMAASGAAGGLIARGAARMASKAEKERSAVASSAQSHTHFLDSPRMQHVLGACDYSPADIKRHPATLFLVLPADRLATHGRWLRLMVSLILTDITRTAGRPELPVLCLLDEFAALGRLQTVETAMGLMAGYGVRLWPVLQDFSQLRTLYGDRWQTFTANAGVLQGFAVNDTLTAREMSAMLGTRGAIARSSSRFGRSNEGSSSYAAQSRPLLYPDEVMRLPPTETLLLPRGRPPVRARKLAYWRDREFRGLADPNPYFAGGLVAMATAAAPDNLQPANDDAAGPDHAGVVLPPPAEPFLAYARAAVAAGLQGGGNGCRDPGIAEWAPVIAAALDAPDWQRQLGRLILAGMEQAGMQSHAWLIPGTLSHPGFRDAMRRALSRWWAGR